MFLYHSEFNYQCMKNKILSGALMLSVFLFGGCEEENNITEVTESPNAKDLALDEALISASNGTGKSFYRLPLSLSEIPQDPNNPLTEEKVALGKLLFHETGLASNPKKEEGRFTYSCSSCHHADGGFQAGLPQGISEGGLGFGLHGEGRYPNPAYPIALLDVQQIRTPSAMNIAYQPNVLWNGQFGATHENEGTDAVWDAGSPKEWNHLGFEGTETQAVAAMDVHRLGMTESLFVLSGYREMFQDAFGNLSDDTLMSDVYVGLAIAAYERTILATEAPFQKWLSGDMASLSDQEKDGAILFFTKGECYKCHNGPALSSMEFHALGMKELNGPGVYLTNFENQTVKLGRGGFTLVPSDEYKFKVPQLYNLIDSRFYGHGASFTSIQQIIEYKDGATPENLDVPNEQLSEHFHPLGLSNQEIEAISAFVEFGLYDPNLDRYVPESIPSGYCFPNNDHLSGQDLGCE